MRLKLSLAAALLAGAALAGQASAKTTVNLCTGADGQPYSAVGKMIADQLRGDPNVEVRVVVDTGGTWGNIQRTTEVEGTEENYASGAACHAFIGQPDGPVLLKRTNPSRAADLRQVGALHREYLHVLCSKESGIGELDDIEGMKDKIVAIGDQGSGAWIIWQNFISEDDGYAPIQTSTESGIGAVSSVANGEATCMLVPAGAPNSVVSDADADFGDQLVVASANDKDFNDAVDIQGKTLYEFVSLPKVYKKNLQGFMSGGVETVSWYASVYVNKQRVTDGKVLGALIKAVAKARPNARAQFGE
jgi:TRAP-type uncharacterized transport system substrate-binding protein